MTQTTKYVHNQGSVTWCDRKEKEKKRNNNARRGVIYKEVLIVRVVELDQYRVFIGVRDRVRETFKLNQLKSAPSQLPLVFKDMTGCKLVAIHLDWPISYCFLLSAG